MSNTVVVFGCGVCLTHISLNWTAPRVWVCDLVWSRPGLDHGATAAAAEEEAGCAGTPADIRTVSKQPGLTTYSSNFVAKFSNPSNFFFQKHLATNLTIFKIYLATFSNFWQVTQTIKGTFRMMFDFASRRSLKIMLKRCVHLQVRCQTL